MGSYHNIRLPVDIERGATGGGEFFTTIVELSQSGTEQRNINWSQIRPEYDIGYGILEDNDYWQVRNFFYARQGRAFSFPFRDWGDYQIPDGLGTPQSIGTGDDSVTAFQIYKSYPSGSFSYLRLIEKPVSGTVQVYLDDVLQGSGFSIDHDSGIITFSTPPGAGVDVGVICEFDTPVRFNVDKFDLTLEQIQAGSVPRLPIIGVNGERE